MRRFLLALAGLALAGGISPVTARDVEADPTKQYPIVPEAGAWMICVASYSGPMAAELANELVLEIRRDYQLPAYLFNRGADEKRKQEEEIARIHQLAPGGRVRRVRIDEQFAVLIGGYKDMAAARRELDHIKKLKPPSKKLMNRVNIAVPAKDERDQPKLGTAYVNPFAQGFVVHNPTVTMEKEPEKPDESLKKLNSGEKYSLLRCKKRYTLMVHSFQGATAIQSYGASGSFMDKLLGRNYGDRLNAAGLQAQEVARVLRDLKFDAYVLHMRHGSLVTVGGYDTPNDPELLRNQRQLANARFGEVLQLLPQPVLMEVPRP